MDKTKTYYYYLFIIALFITSCKSQSLIPGFPIGLSENDTRANIKQNISEGIFLPRYKYDSTDLYYNWKLGDTSIFTRVSFNHDGVVDGNLRILVIHLTDTAIVKDIPESVDEVMAKKVMSDEILHLSLSPTETRIVYSMCPESKLIKALSHLRKEYGKEDSIKVEKALNDDLKEDTVYVKYYFHDKNSEIVLRREKMAPASAYIPVPHTHSAEIYQLSKTYDSEFNTVREEKRRQLKPSDVIRVPIEYRIIRQQGEFGLPETSLALTININIMNRRTLVETRNIRSMKGNIVIKDDYDAVLQTIEDLEYDANDLNSEKAGIVCALGGEFLPSQSTIYKATVNVDSRLSSREFRDAVKYNRTLNIEFVPTAIRFSDGTILH